MLPTFKRAFRRSAVFLSLFAAALALAAPPASAHTVEDAVRAPAGCSWLTGGYDTLHSSPVTTSSGAVYGRVYLLWSGTYQQNCVITLKPEGSPFHGTATWTQAELFIQPNGRYYEQGDYGHYASTRAATAGLCVAYAGTIRSAPGSSGGTVATGGRSSWGNCG
ncbi:hypothetical protein ACFO4E_01390 [Nocardiopsis mangrovi]|uniref:Spore-associated protein A n=1 Tax=Nocardiopsis mangrovi TaxID=1179818 RepID=A0ABV9DP15_9ACTN